MPEASATANTAKVSMESFSLREGSRVEVVVSVTHLVTNSCLALPLQSMSQLQSLLPAFNIINQLKWPYSYLSNTNFS